MRKPVIGFKEWRDRKLESQAVESPLRAELFSEEQLQRHAAALAGQHQLNPKRVPNRLLLRLADNERILIRTYDLVSCSESECREIAPACEWLLDNFYLIEQQIRLTRLHLPRTYSRELPCLLAGPVGGPPRIYDIALELISHADGRIDEENINHFISAYQSVTDLKLGELWAVPIMLRLGLIENLRRVSLRIAQRRKDRNLANLWAGHLLAAADRKPATVLNLLAELAESNPPFNSQFVEEFCARLHDQSPVLATVQSWVQHHLTEQGLNREQLQRADHQIQAADQVSIGNSIGSLRFLGAMDWRKFVETHSVVERLLNADPSGWYVRMDFVTRDRYRQCVEKLSRRAGLSEKEVVHVTIRLATEAAAGAEGLTARAAHVGFYLVDSGRGKLERAIGVSWSLRRSIIRTVRRFPVICYLGILLLITGVTVGLGLLPVLPLGWQDWRLWLFLIFGVSVASQLAVTLVNMATNLLLGPRYLPRLDYSKGIPESDRTMVVIPTLLSSPQAVTDLIENLEIRYLGNRDTNLFFALLTDFSDAPEETQSEDLDLLQQVCGGIESLNLKYSPGGVTVFQLFHRPRVWNPHEHLWMGYERKRGKLEQFNELLRGGPTAPFSEIISDSASLPGIRYVITLDTDTGLPRDAARKLVGSMAHPLNRPRFDPIAERVVEGYAILQPRTPISLLSANRSRFSRLSAGEAGIDPYTREVSDVYQDLFSEGSYVGKGIYDVDAFRQTTAGRFPENLILSHDLVESGHARSALVSDVELYEDHPASFTAEISRRHRWIRGDWQIAGWLLPRVLGPFGQRRANKLTALSWWKIFDNLRRSLVTPATLMLLLAGWMLAPEPTGFWTLYVLMLLLFPLLVTTLVELFGKPRDRSRMAHLGAVRQSLSRKLAETGLMFSSLPYRAVVHLDAILASGGRMLFTRRGLLLWHTPRYARRNNCTTLSSFLREMWVAPLFAMAGIAWLGLTHPGELIVSGPVLLLWMVSPLLCWWISLPLMQARPELTSTQETFLRGLSRQTWRYFEVLVDEQENWLPPDNFQELPTPTPATRTSPTNIGMALLANLTASDFGYLSIGGLLDRTDKTFSTMERLERYRGHFYNWYDTRTLESLQPFYVSSVDSGNLAGALHTLRAGLLELKDQKIVSPRVFEGLRDTLEMSSSPAVDRLRVKLQDPPPADLRSCVALLGELSQEIAALPATGDEEGQWWTDALVRQCEAARDDLQFLIHEAGQFHEIPTLQELADAPTGGDRAAVRIRKIDQLAGRCAGLLDMDFSFLYDAASDLLSIGYNVADHRLDPSRYDLLASEARVASFILVARNQLPQEHWFALGRQLTTHHGSMALLSWSGSMFEYLMPLLVMPNCEHTLLNETYRAVVSRQIEYGRQRGVPWGVSESCYNVTDARGIYQYAAFGVPGLGLKRGLADDLVVAPYASMLALMVAPREACKNLEKLAAAGYQGTFGFYEAIDFTPSRLPLGKTCAPLRSFMAHHQGMSLLSLAYLLLNRPMQRRFLSDPYFKASEMLLHERIPRISAPMQPHTAEVNAARQPPVKAAATMRVFSSPQTAIPETHLLSNGRYLVMATNSGGGFSRWKDLAVTRWREDATSDCWGTFCYLRDTETGNFWSTAHQPTRRSSKHYEAIFVQGRAEYRRRDEGIDSHTEVAVSPEDDVEVRRVTLTNFSFKSRTIEMTSYAELVLAPLASDLSHPAFSNLFVHTEILPESQAILCTRRSRSPGDQPPWMFHLMTAQGSPAGDTSYETDRTKFIGRCRSVANPAAFDEVSPLSGSEGPVLDPIVAIRRSVAIQPDTSANWHIISGMADTRAGVLALIDKYRDPSFAARAFEMARSHSQVVLLHLHATEAEARLYEQLAGSIIHANALHRASAPTLVRNQLGQAGLWSFGISGDLPILLVRIADIHRLELVRQALRAHAYWHEKGLEVDLVILNEDFSGYRNDLQDRIMGLIAAGTEAHRVDKPGGIFPRRSGQMHEEDRVLLDAVARVILSDIAGTFAVQVERRAPLVRKVASFKPSQPAVPVVIEAPPPYDRMFFNGLGGFTPDGREYVISLAPGQTTPAPWVNVLANSQIGTVISESGGAYTWVDNAHEFRLTPWHNDPLTDPSGEAFYIRDEETGQFWSPTPMPARGRGAYTCRHGFGYSVFESTQLGISSELWTYVALDAPVKMVVVKVRNHSGRTRRLSVTGYWEWVLGESRNANMMHVVSEIDPATRALFVRNRYHREFSGKTVFVSVSEAERTFTANRVEFLGRNGTLTDPAAMKQEHLSGHAGAGLDPCAALQAAFELLDGDERELVFILGAADNAEAAQKLVGDFSGPTGARLALERVWDFWRRTLGTIQVETPDPGLDILANGWLEYQALACRYWGRSGYYQSGGAYGFRDQLQDTAALLHAAPWATREHLLRSAGRQFQEGDVQHWWHPPNGRGVRTHCSDDYLWLPYSTCRYVAATGDVGVLQEHAPFLDGRLLNAGEESYYDLPQRAAEDGTLYEHCVRAIKHGLRFGSHGLPLMGGGDWNDGMNLVGEEGAGESVWLAFFLYDVLRRFEKLARRLDDAGFAEECAAQATWLKENIERHGWDGQWYRRAYFDDGTPLGSATNQECRIDSIAQSWAVLSGAADPDRARLAMASMDQRLVRREARLIQLFDPPFDTSALEPGYIKGYTPGVRENGGQYTHAAIWAVMALAELGETERAWELFSLINPIRHATDPAEVGRYKVEPYVVAADVYGQPPHIGRGGWTWYTGSAAWMHRLILETLLGIHLEVDRLRINPRLPRAWKSFKIHYRYHNTFYHITIVRTEAYMGECNQLVVDGENVAGQAVPLVDDRQEHTVELKFH